MGEGRILPGVWGQNEDTYVSILSAAEWYTRLMPPGEHVFETEHLRLLLAEPGWPLWSSKTPEEADLKLAARLAPGDPRSALKSVELLRDWLEGLGVAPMEDETCTQRKFVGHLNQLRRMGLLLKVGKGKYRLSPTGKIQQLLNQSEAPSTLSEESPAISVNLSPELTDHERRLAGMLTDVVGLAGEILGLLQGGASPERLPGSLKGPRPGEDEGLRITVQPVWWQPSEGGDVAVAALGPVDGGQTAEWAERPERYESYLDEAITRVGEVREALAGLRP